MEAIGKAGFGFEFRNFEDNCSAELNAYQRIMEKMMDIRLMIPKIGSLFRKQNEELESDFKRFNTLLMGVIAKKKAQCAAEESQDLLDLLILAHDDQDTHLTDEELLHNVGTFFLAGHETSSVALTTTLYLLAQNPDAQNKARKEVLTLLGTENEPTYDLCMKMQYLNAVLKENLRIYPPVGSIPRLTTSDCELAGYFIPKGSIISIWSQVFQNSPEHWENPKAFLPERFLNECEGENKFRPWIPFGGGSRSCIGNNFAILELKVIISTLLRKFSFETKEQIKFTRAMTLKPRADFKMIVKNVEI